MNSVFSARTILMSILAVSLATTAISHAEEREADDAVKRFVDRDQIVTNIRDAETMGLMEHTLTTRPWSGTFWADVKGSIAVPYADRSFPQMGWNWPLNRKYIRDSRKDMYKHIDELTDDQIAMLSPAEKYDLLVGDTNFTFTSQVLSRVNQMADYHLIAGYTGICHGWSPASLNMPRPKHSFTLRSYTGRIIKFYPEDVKALESFLWAMSPSNGDHEKSAVRVNGWKCRDMGGDEKLKFGGKMTDYGRSLDPECFDVNPAFFHLLLLNQIGLNDHGFVMDRSWGREVQNQPVYGYKLSYYNPMGSWDDKLTLDKARVVINSSTKDPFQTYRSSKTREIVGVEAKIYYAAENNPSQDDVDSTDRDKSGDVTYHYTLELDESGSIVGGEWQMYDKNESNRHDRKSFSHPDTVWLFPKKWLALSNADSDVYGVYWYGDRPMPDAWRQAAIKAANSTYKYEILKDRQKVKKDLEKQLGRVPTWSEVQTKHEQFEKDFLRPQPLANIVNLLVSKATE